MLCLFHQELRALFPLSLQQLLQTLGCISVCGGRPTARQHRAERWWGRLRCARITGSGRLTLSGERRSYQGYRRFHERVRVDLHTQLVGHFLRYCTVRIELIAEHVGRVNDPILKQLAVFGIRRTAAIGRSADSDDNLAGVGVGRQLPVTFVAPADRCASRVRSGGTRRRLFDHHRLRGGDNRRGRTHLGRISCCCGEDGGGRSLGFVRELETAAAAKRRIGTETIVWRSRPPAGQLLLLLLEGRNAGVRSRCLLFVGDLETAIAPGRDRGRRRALYGTHRHRRNALQYGYSSRQTAAGVQVHRRGQE